MMQTHMTESRKPAFRWLGTKDDLVGPASRKRMAGMCSSAQHPIYSSLPANKTGRGVKRFPGTENMVKGDQTVLKRATLKPLQPRCPNTMAPYPKELINKPVPLYPRTPQGDTPVPDATKVVGPMAPGPQIGVAVGTTGY